MSASEIVHFLLLGFGLYCVLFHKRLGRQAAQQQKWFLGRITPSNVQFFQSGYVFVGAVFVIASLIKILGPFM
jgi:hypothetical protein